MKQSLHSPGDLHRICLTRMLKNENRCLPSGLIIDQHQQSEMQAQVAEDRVQLKPVSQQKFMFTSIRATMEHHFINLIRLKQIKTIYILLKSEKAKRMKCFLHGRSLSKLPNRLGKSYGNMQAANSTQPHQHSSTRVKRKWEKGKDAWLYDGVGCCTMVEVQPITTWTQQAGEEPCNGTPSSNSQKRL